MTCWPRAPCRLSICSLYSLSALLSFSLSSFPALVLKDLFCSRHAQTVAQFRIKCAELWSPIKEGLWIRVDLQMLLHPAVMGNEPHESQELLCFNPWRLYFESMMIWCIGLLHYISRIWFSLSCYWLSISVPSRASWHSLEILWQPHWYFSWFLTRMQQMFWPFVSTLYFTNKTTGYCDILATFALWSHSITTLLHSGIGKIVGLFLSGWGWTGHQTYYYLSIIFILCLLSSPLCSVFITDAEPSNIWSGQIWLLGTLAFFADHSIFKCGLTPFRWSLLNILTVCCTSLSRHWSRHHDLG